MAQHFRFHIRLKSLLYVPSNMAVTLITKHYQLGSSILYSSKQWKVSVYKRLQVTLVYEYSSSNVLFWLRNPSLTHGSDT